MTITDILSVSWGFDICTTEEEPYVNGHLFICSPVLYYRLGSLIYLDGVGNSYSDVCVWCEQYPHCLI